MRLWGLWWQWDTRATNGLFSWSSCTPTTSIPSCFPAPAMPWARFSPDLDAQLPILLLIIVFARRGQYL